MSIWPGTKGKQANVIPSTLKPALVICDQHFYMVQMAEGSDEEDKHPVSPPVTDRFTGFSAIPLFHAALQPKGVERG